MFGTGGQRYVIIPSLRRAKWADFVIIIGTVAIRICNAPVILKKADQN